MVGQYIFRFLFARRILAVSDRTPSSPGQLAVRFRTVPGRYYGVQRARSLGGPWHSSDDFPASCMEFSTDLKTWHRLTDQPAQSHGLPTIWLDASATNAPTRYYRAVAP